MLKKQNPVLTGFHPDPSMCRVGDDYYIATSTFQWFPGVQLYHSRDLVNFEELPQPLRRVSQLDMRGAPNSGGVWAPCLSYSDGIYYLIYTSVKNFHGIYKDTHNYLVYTDDIRGEWSDPVYLNSSGFDPSLFHDDDGRKYLVNMVWDSRFDKHAFGGIRIQEYDHEKKCLVGESSMIYEGIHTVGGETIGAVEGPHLYKHNGYYYLMVAEGGTCYHHGVRLARSKNILGPYETDEIPLLTARHDPEVRLQRAGHASFIEAANGDLYIAHLCGRPVMPEKRCILGRETAIQKVKWENGWLRLENGGYLPADEYTSTLPEHQFEPRAAHEEFDMDKLPPHYQTLRIPFAPERQSLTERKGWLRLYGREAITSHNEQSMVARRLEHFNAKAEALMEFSPRDFQQMAGIALFYDTANFFYFYMTRGEGENVLRLDIRNNLVFVRPPFTEIGIGDATAVYLRLEINSLYLDISYSLDGENYQYAARGLYLNTLTDEAYFDIGMEGHTGTFIALACQDLSGKRNYADFRYMEYLPIDKE